MVESDDLRVGFIGMGIMGAAMARNCIKAGYAVTVYNRTAAKAAPLADAGAAIADSPADVARVSDVVLICVTASADVLSVVLDESSGVIAGVAPGATVIDHSTVAPKVATQCSEALASKGATFLDAPISGGDVGARNGTLSIMVGGDRARFDECLPILQAMGKTITWCGESGAGYTVKLCNQICGAMHLIAAAEAIQLADKANIDPKAMLKAISSGAAGSWMLDHLAPKMIAGDFKPGFFVDYQLKDLRLAVSLAGELAIELPGASLAAKLFETASQQGHGTDGTQAIYDVVKNLPGK